MKRGDFLKTIALGGLAVIFSPDILMNNENIKKIYLTIDDGPRDSHGEILDSLRGNHATFFMVGRILDTQRGFDSACRTLELGNEIGNHSYSHPEFSKINFEEIKTEISRTHEIIERAYSLVGKVNPHLFRFPYGDHGNSLMEMVKENHEFNKAEKTSAFLKTFGYTSYGWDRDSEDWKYYIPNGKKSLEEIMGRVKKTQEGDIVLVHDLPITAKNIIPFLVDSGRYELARL